MDLLLRLMGIRSIEDAKVVERSIHYSNCATPFQKLIFLLAAALVIYIVWWFYKREPAYCSLRKKRLMAGLRCAGVAVLLFILSGPVLKITLNNNVKGKVVVLMDTSLSMTRQDKYSRPEDKLVAAHVLGKVPLKETDPNKVNAEAEAAVASTKRIDLAKSIFHNKDFKFLETLQKQYDVEMWSFSRAADMKSLDPGGKKIDPTVVDSLVADGMVTEIGGSIRATLNRLKGQALSAIVMVTDGGNNKGEEPAIVAQDAPARIYPIGIGVPEARDVAISYVFMESKIFVDDRAPIYVRLKQHGFNGEKADLIVSANTEEIGRQEVTLKDAGEQNEIVTVTPKKAGKYTYRVEVRLRQLASEDSEPGNNFKSRDVEVIDQKLNVLLVESEPRWEYRFLKNALLRDRRVNCRILLRVPHMDELGKGGSTDPSKPAPTPFLQSFPPPTDLFKYHVIIFGNMPNDGFFTETDLTTLRRFVIEEGGGMWFIAGKNNMPDSYKDSKLEMLLPIEFETNQQVTAEDEQQNPLTEPVRLILTPEGRSHSVTRLDIGTAEGSDDTNAGLWELVPEIYWYHRATRPKLGASTLLVAGVEKGGRETRGGPPPLLVTSQVGRGRVLYQAFADLWRMRYPAELGPDALERLQGHVVQYLGLAKLLGRTAKVEINTDKEEYAIGDRIKVNARVLKGQDMMYSDADHVTAVATDADSEANQYQVGLTPEPGQRGVFRGEFVAQHEGKFRVTLKDVEDDAGAHADFTVIIPQLEMETPDMKKELLDNIAKSSLKTAAPGETKAGMYFADQVPQLLKDLHQAQRVVEEHKEMTLWDAPLLLILFTLFMGLEWLFRKRSDLL
ncbi:MAG TPA: hypothetical protein VGP72_08450 [Planctomycetota bacterium]|jgi:hypothetical protein